MATLVYWTIGLTILSTLLHGLLVLQSIEIGLDSFDHGLDNACPIIDGCIGALPSFSAMRGLSRSHNEIQILELQSHDKARLPDHLH